MANGRPGDSRYHDVVRLRIATFGPSNDALIRDIAKRLPRSHLGEFRELIEDWPWQDDGTPRNPDAMFRALTAWRERVRSLPRDPAEEGAAPPPRSVLRTLFGLLLGGVVGLAAGFFAYLIAREAVLPTSLWSSDPVMWVIILAVAVPVALFGVWSGRARRALAGFLIGSIVAGTLAGILGALLSATARSGDEAMGTAIGILLVLMPFAALVGGVAGAVLFARR